MLGLILVRKSDMASSFCASSLIHSGFVNSVSFIWRTSEAVSRQVVYDPTSPHEQAQRQLPLKGRNLGQTRVIE